MENIVVVREFDAPVPGSTYELDLTRTTVRDCVGCWSCWWKTPGRCVFHDLDELYRAVVAADRVVILSRVSLDFVSGNLKTLFDRMIPLALPFISYKTGESRHVPRYEKHPVFEVYYEGEFSSEEARVLYEEYMSRVADQFCSECDKVLPAAALLGEEKTV